MSDVKVDSTAIDAMLRSLEGDLRQGILLKALKAGGKVLQENTQAALSARMGSAARSAPHSHIGSRTTHNRPLVKGVTLKADKNYDEVRVSILGDYRLKWFEMGTAERKLKRTGAKDRSRGRYKGDRRYLYRKKGKETFYRAGSSRGRIRPERFFSSARQNEAPVMQAIEQSFFSQFNKYTK